MPIESFQYFIILFRVNQVFTFYHFIVSKYMLVNKLHINLGKLCYIKFGPISNITETKLEDRLIKIGETPIKQVSETKFLGIIIDDKLSWNPQIQYLRRKLSSSISILNRIKDSIPILLHKHLYHTLFESHLCYGITSRIKTPVPF